MSDVQPSALVQVTTKESPKNKTGKSLFFDKISSIPEIFIFSNFMFEYHQQNCENGLNVMNGIYKTCPPLNPNIKPADKHGEAINGRTPHGELVEYPPSGSTPAQNIKAQPDLIPVLIGNSFPMSLIRRRVLITPGKPGRLQKLIRKHGYMSFWGHANTLSAASEMMGVDLTPSPARPALQLTPDGFPTLDQLVFDSCWLLSPNYSPGFRPTAGQEVAAESILGWEVLLMRWPRKRTTTHVKK